MSKCPTSAEIATNILRNIKHLRNYIYDLEAELPEHQGTLLGYCSQIESSAQQIERKHKGGQWKDEY